MALRNDLTYGSYSVLRCVDIYNQLKDNLYHDDAVTGTVLNAEFCVLPYQNFTQHTTLNDRKCV